MHGIVRLCFLRNAAEEHYTLAEVVGKWIWIKSRTPAVDENPYPGSAPSESTMRGLLFDSATLKAQSG